MEFCRREEYGAAGVDQLVPQLLSKVCQRTTLVVRTYTARCGVIRLPVIRNNDEAVRVNFRTKYAAEYQLQLLVTKM